MLILRTIYNDYICSLYYAGRLKEAKQEVSNKLNRCSRIFDRGLWICRRICGWSRSLTWMQQVRKGGLPPLSEQRRQLI